MAWSIDARVPVCFGVEPGDGDAALVEDGAAEVAVAAERFGQAAGHVAGCACCVERSPAAAALDRLFQRRARGEIAFFRRVVAVTTGPDGDMAVWSAVRNDRIASARYRLEGGSAGTS